MSEIHGDGGPLPPIPDDLLISQFILDRHHPSAPMWAHKMRPWLIEEASGRQIGSDELRGRMHGLTNALRIRWNIGMSRCAFEVCIFTHNHVDFPVVLWYVSRCDNSMVAEFMNANPSYTAEELTYQLQVIKAQLLIAHPSMLQIALDAARAAGIPQDRIVLMEPVEGSPYPNVDELVRFGLTQPKQVAQLRLKPGEAKTKLALLSFSSGTTGLPKAIMISHYSLISNVIMHAHHINANNENIPLEERFYRPGGITYAILPWYHAFGIHFVLFLQLFLGNTIVVAPKFSLQQMLESIQRYRITHLALVPPQVVLMCKSPVIKDYDLSSVYFLIAGAAPMSAEITEQIVRILPNSIIGQGYGLTESATGMSFPAHGQRVGTLGAAGTLLPGVIARVVKPDGTLAGFDELGELYIKAPSIAHGYLNNPTATADTFVDGFLRTGDEVRISARKELFVVDRIKELIKVRGAQVAPSELEGHLLRHAAVRDVCVVPVPDEYSGELPVAFVALHPDAHARAERDPGAKARAKAELMEHVAKHKTRYKWLAGVEFIETIPKNPSGKLLRRVLREQARDMLAKGTLTVQTSARRAKL
ncbi:acetyl-CoA synthetase-like protein [Epithele typhae]|uniref:acetyl-CoA synthetase-like protein n=1 Tax=Epithele typhae TaxID=378194 RepID=UPI002008A6B4|nr:acetyl-CoA synthetase-like protein [Epithele typhae]KAH9927962.1 acetyl-CoA synthetase-like protein [Epithele typhae]